MRKLPVALRLLGDMRKEDLAVPLRLSVDEATREERSRQCRSWAAHFRGDGAIDA
jgi:hypothetical protein